DMICSKEGWSKTFKKDSVYLKFTPNDLTNRKIKATCVQNKCLDRVIDVCKGETGDYCKEPDYLTEKYR
ncbi:hypothetical protein PFISCL1PPCAC_17291, partial [Pristionchus fissidentatus]